MAMKKGFFFTFDAFLAIILFVVILFSLFSYYISAKSMTQQYYYSEDILGVLSNVKISELDLEKYEEINNLVEFNEIENTNLVIMEQISNFNSLNKQDEAAALARSVTEGLIPENYGIGVYIEGEDIYTSKAGDVSSLVSRQRLVKGGSIDY